jgi:hypothetical protein
MLVPKCRLSAFCLMSVALLGVPVAMAASDSLVCLNTATKLEVGILVTDDTLLAAHLACERAKERASDGVTLMKLVVASGAIDDEYRRRTASIIEDLTRRPERLGQLKAGSGQPLFSR